LLRRLTWFRWVDDERAVEALRNVLLERRRMAVIELHAVGTGWKLVRVAAARFDDLEDAVHVRGVDPVEVDRVRVRACVRQVDSQQIALRRSDHGSATRAVVRPGGADEAFGD